MVSFCGSVLLATLALLTAGCGSTESSDLTESASSLPAVVFTRATGTELAGETERRANADLYILRDPGSSPEELTSGAGSDTGATWSADGSTVYFARSSPSGAGDLSSEIFKVDVEGGEPTRVTHCNPPQCESDSEPRVSPDGETLSFLRSGPDGVAVFEMPLPDGSPRAIALPQGFRPFTSPSWRSDDEVSLSGYSAGSKVAAFSAPASSLTTLKSLPICTEDADCTTPGSISWASASSIGVVEADGSDGDPAIFALGDEPATASIVGCLDKGRCPHRPSITGDGAHIVFDVGDDFGGDLYTAGATGDDLEQLTEGSELDCCAAFAPQGGS